MMPAAKAMDPVMGVDIHMIQPPGPVPPVPIPHPHIGMVMDPVDFVPVVGATVHVNGMPRAQSGTGGKCLPPHIPIGGTFIKPPGNENEIFMGSATVLADEEPLSYMALPVLSCQDVGMPPPPRMKKKSGTKSLTLPTSVVIAIPMGMPVLVGGPPTISLMAMGMKAAGAMFAMVKKTKAFKKAMAAAQKAKKKIFKNMKPGFIKCTVLKAEPVDITSGEVVVEQSDFSLDWPLPLDWTRSYRSRSSRAGVCGVGWETIADARLELEDRGATFHMVGDGPTYFPDLPAAEPVEEWVDGAVLAREPDGLVVRLKSGLRFHFDHPRAGERELIVRRITDRRGQSLVFTRDAGGLSRIDSSVGVSVAVRSRGGRAEVLTLVAPGEEPRTLATYEYDERGDLRGAGDPLGQVRRFFYDAHRMTRHTDRNGLSFHYEFDAEGRVVHAWGDGGLYDYRFSYEAAGSVVRTTDSLGHTTVVEMNAEGLPVREVDPLGRATEYEYDEVGRTTAVIAPGGARTEYHYDDHGNVTKLVRPDGAAVEMAYDEHDQMVALTTPAGEVWRQEWTHDGLLHRQITPLGNATTYGYDDRGAVREVVSPTGRRTRLETDAAGRPVAVFEPGGGVVGYGWDAMGNLLSRTDPLGGVSRYTYDAGSRLLSATSAAGRTEHFRYDGESHLTRYVDGEGHTTELDIVGLGQVRRRRQPDGRIVEYIYDTEERLIAVVNQRGQRYSLERDPLGRVVAETDYWGRTRRYEYDKAGRLSRSVDALGRVIKYESDALGRLKSKTLPGGATESFAYDADGNHFATDSPHAKVTRRFDAEGRLVREQINGFWAEYAYDAEGRRVRRTTSHGTTVEQRFDESGLVASISINGTQAASVQRDAAGSPVVERLGPCERRSRYDADGLLIGRSLAGRDGPLFERAYEYDRRGELVSRSDSRWGVDKFLYDPMGRVRRHTDPAGRVKQYLHDPAGDLLREVEADGMAEPATPDEKDASGGWRRAAAYDGVVCLYDAAGNMVLRRDDRGELRLEWDANNRLVRTRNADGSETSYGYDAQGRRVYKETKGRDGVVRRVEFGWDGDAIASDTAFDDAMPARTREFVYVDSSFEPLAMVAMPAATKERPAAACAKAARVYHYHNDPNGAPHDLTDDTGVPVWSASYSPTGSATVHRHDTDQPLRLQGQYYDTETGLAQNRHRYFDGRLGAFVSLDPLGPLDHASLLGLAPNIYGWVDPLGLQCKKVHPKKVNFSQDSIKKEFQDGGDIYQLAKDLKSGKIKPEDIPPIRVTEIDGQLVSVDNRRLAAFRMAEMDVPIKQMSPSELAREQAKGKFSAGPKGGSTIRVRDAGPGQERFI